MVTQRQFMIIFLFWKKNHEYTSKELSHELHLSERTIKNEVNSLQSNALQYGFSIRAKRGAGYQFQIVEDEIFRREVLPYIASYAEVRELPDEKEKRIYQVMSLLFQENFVSADKISASIFIDKRTLHKTFQDIRIILKRYHLVLISKPYYGFSIEGSELHKRFCIMDLYAHYHHLSFLIQKDLLYRNFFYAEEGTQRSIRRVWLNFMREQTCMLRDIHLEKFVYHLLISYRRFQLGHIVSFTQKEKEEITFRKSYQMIQELKEKLKEEKLISIQESEVYYLSVVLFCYLDVHEQEEMKCYPYFYERSRLCVEDSMQVIQQRYPAFVFSKDFQQILQFTSFPMVVRMHYHLYEENTWLRNWRYRNVYTSLVSLELAYISLNSIMRLSENEKSSDDIAQLAFAYQALLASQGYPHKRNKILIIPPSGYISAQTISQNLMHSFSYCIDSIAIKERYYLHGVEDVEEYDVLISNPEYCEEFKGHITLLYDYVVLEHHYKELYDCLVGATEQNENFLPANIECLKTTDCATFQQLFSLLFSPTQAKQEMRLFQEREQDIFNLCLRPCAGFTHFVADAKEERFCIVQLKKPIIWHRIAIHSVVICLFYPDSLLKCRFYDTLFYYILHDPAALTYLYEHPEHSTIHSIMKQAR